MEKGASGEDQNELVERTCVLSGNTHKRIIRVTEKHERRIGSQISRRRGKRLAENILVGDIERLTFKEGKEKVRRVEIRKLAQKCKIISPEAKQDS